MKEGSGFPLDFGDIRGQAAGKRCARIAAAGWHHLLLIGPPGSGKTMMAERIPYIMPPMSREEQMGGDKNLQCGRTSETGERTGFCPAVSKTPPFGVG